MSDPEWQIIKDEFPRQKNRSSKKIADQRGSECGLLHFQRWGLMGHAANDFPLWESVSDYLREWKKSGL